MTLRAWTTVCMFLRLRRSPDYPQSFPKAELVLARTSSMEPRPMKLQRPARVQRPERFVFNRPHMRRSTGKTWRQVPARLTYDHRAAIDSIGEYAEKQSTRKTGKGRTDKEPLWEEFCVALAPLASAHRLPVMSPDGETPSLYQASAPASARPPHGGMDLLIQTDAPGGQPPVPPNDPADRAGSVNTIPATRISDPLRSRCAQDCGEGLVSRPAAVAKRRRIAATHQAAPYAIAEQPRAQPPKLASGPTRRRQRDASTATIRQRACHAVRARQDRTRPVPTSYACLREYR